MIKRTRSLFLLASVVVAGIVFSSPSSARTSLASIQASIDALTARVGDLEARHAGLSVEDHVVLVWLSPGNPDTLCRQPNREFRRYFPDGSFENIAYVVPAGRLLVVTDVDATVRAGVGSNFGVGHTVHAALTMDNNNNSSLVPHTTSGIAVTIAAQESISVSSQLGTPVLIGSGRQVCVRGEERTNTGGYLFRDVTTSTIRGYLIDAP